MRGDRPVIYWLPILIIVFTPHARGSTCEITHAFVFGCVYPACAGIDPTASMATSLDASLPRMRGDRPYAQQLREEKAQFTPHARGSTMGILAGLKGYEVYPACAGIDHPKSYTCKSSNGLPRMRGDRPKMKKSEESW